MAAERPELLRPIWNSTPALISALRNWRRVGRDIVQRNGFPRAPIYSPAPLERLPGPRLRAGLLAHQPARVRYTPHTGVMPMLDYLDGLA